MSNFNSNNCDATQECATTERQAIFTPAVDIHEKDTEFVLEADLPGATSEHVEVSYEDGVLTLRADVPPRTAPDAEYLRHEYRVGAYERRFRIGEDVDVEAIEARMTDGVLTLVLPKTAATRRRRIEIKAG